MNCPSHRPAPGRAWFLPADHACDRPGVPDPYLGSLTLNEAQQTLASYIVEAAVQRVVFPVRKLHQFILAELQEVHRFNITGDYAERIQELFALYEELLVAEMMMVTEIAGLVLADQLPPGMGRLDELVAACMSRAGLCCPEAADALISEAVGPVTLAAVNRLAAREDWDAACLTMRGALARWWR